MARNVRFPPPKADTPGVLAPCYNRFFMKNLALPAG